jgi:hypothetical protein
VIEERGQILDTVLAGPINVLDSQAMIIGRAWLRWMLAGRAIRGRNPLLGPCSVQVYRA